MKRPARITVIGILFLIGGCLAAWGIIVGLFHGRLNLNFAALMIPVGIGLLKGRASSWGWARFWIGLFAMAAGILLFFYPFYGATYSVKWRGEQLTGFPRDAMAIGCPVIILLISGWMWRSFSLPSVAPFFDDFQNAKEQQSASGDPQ